MLPTLYKKTKTGAIQTYEVATLNQVITVTQGQLNGKKQSYNTICEGKNLGRANATSPSAQALLEAASKHAAKLKSGYVLDPSGELVVRLPMKVKCYQDQVKNVIFPCYDSLKLNGINGTYRLENGSLKLYSRGGELYPEIPHHKEEILQILLNLNTDELNGEIYIHKKQNGDRYHLQELVSLILRPSEDSKLLEFHVFDAPNVKGSFKERYAILSQIIEKGTYETSRWDNA